LLSARLPGLPVAASIASAAPVDARAPKKAVPNQAFLIAALMWTMASMNAESPARRSPGITEQA